MKYRIYSFRFAKEIFESIRKELYNEILEIIEKEININRENIRKAHKIIQETFKKHGWSTEEVIDKVKIPLKHDLYKERIAIEVETSHIVHTYKDYLKFIASYNIGKIDLGIIITWTKQHITKHNLDPSKPTLEKIRKDLENVLKTIIPVPILIIGLED
ncbi:MAG: hypothetical protein B6U76_11235 [Desulfurococcales archaeon ex4484_217_2]|nr:MAG: hypothetical protein B6U76_11235 [Desulfurococcales archaeon ex4484_217_2]